VSSRRRKPLAASSSLTRRKKSPWKAKSSPPAPVRADVKVHPLEVKTGDRVLFGKWSGTEVKLDGEDLMIMKESDIMGVVDHAAANTKAA